MSSKAGPSATRKDRRDRKSTIDVLEHVAGGLHVVGSAIRESSREGVFGWLRASEVETHAIEPPSGMERKSKRH